jgi:hypothetical protein
MADERKTPAEFTRDMPEGEGAGPDAPETLEATQGRPPGEGPGGPAMKGIGADDDDDPEDDTEDLPERR